MDPCEMENLRLKPQYKILYVLSKNDLKKGLIPIPIEKVYPSLGSCNCMSNMLPEQKSRTVCILFQNRACHEGYKCHQVHVHRNYWKIIEERDYFSHALHLEQEGEITIMYREKGKSIIAQPISVHAQHVYITKGSENYFAEKARTGISTCKEICNYFHKKTCLYRYNCNQIHMDLDLWRNYILPDKRNKKELTEQKNELLPTDLLGDVISEPECLTFNEAKVNRGLMSTSFSCGTDSVMSSLSTPERAVRRRANSTGAKTINCNWYNSPKDGRRNMFGNALLPFRDELWNSLVIGTTKDQSPRNLVVESLPSDVISSTSSQSLFSIHGDSDVVLHRNFFIWAKFADAEIKLKNITDLEDVADLRNCIFSKFLFPPGTVESALHLWYDRKLLDIHTPITAINLICGDTILVKLSKVTEETI